MISNRDNQKLSMKELKARSPNERRQKAICPMAALEMDSASLQSTHAFADHKIQPAAHPEP